MIEQFECKSKMINYVDSCKLFSRNISNYKKIKFKKQFQTNFAINYIPRW